MSKPRVTPFRKKFFRSPLELMNRYLYRYTGGEERPVFFDAGEINPGLERLQRQHREIRAELETALERLGRLTEYRDIDAAQGRISAADEQKWHVLMLYAMGLRHPRSVELFPLTQRLLDEVPHLFQAFFSILEPRKSVAPHPGPYYGYLRYHLGLKVADERPPTLRVKDRHYTWKEGEGVLWDDSWEHEVTNDCDESRVVLIVDVLRPLPPLPHFLNRLVTNTFVRYTYGRHLTRKF